VLEALGIAALALAALSATFLGALVARRAALAREERRRAELERRVRPLALALVADDDVELPELDRDEQTLLAEALGRLSRRVTGGARHRVGAYFAGTTALRAELQALHDRSGWRRATAAYRLGDMACADAVPALREALVDRDGDVRAAAARSLGRLGAGDAAGALVLALVDNAVPRAIAFRAVLDVGADALPDVRRLATAPDPAVRAASAELLGWLGDASDDALLVDALADPAAEVRARAAAALGRLASADGAEALTRALDDRIYFVRLHAARALGQVGERGAVPQLLRQAREDRFEAARAAAEAVARLDPAAVLEVAEDADAGPHLHEAADLLRV
jgi:HEAT repeat protein